MALNINKRINDSFYRYKMPAIDIEMVHGKTVLKNFQRVCSAISRPEEIVSRFLAQMIGTTACCKKGSWTLNGSFEKIKIQEHLFEFIDRYVLCPSCGNPETVFHKPKQFLYLKCLACKFNSTVKQDKITNAIQKSLDDAPKGKMTKKFHKNKLADESLNPEDPTSAESDDDWSMDTSPEAVASRAQMTSSWLIQ